MELGIGPVSMIRILFGLTGRPAAVPAFRPPPCTLQNKKTSRKDGIERQADGLNVKQSISPDIADTFPARLGFSSLGRGPRLSH